MQNPSAHHILARAGCPSEKGGGQKEKKLSVLREGDFGTEMGKALSLQCAKCSPRAQIPLGRANANRHKWTFTSPIFLIKKYWELKKKNRPNPTVFTAFNKTLPFTLRKWTSIHFHKFLFNGFFPSFSSFFNFFFHSLFLFFSLFFPSISKGGGERKQRQARCLSVLWSVPLQTARLPPSTSLTTACQ